MRHLYLLIGLTTQAESSHRIVLDNQLAFLQASYLRLDFLEVLARKVLERRERQRLLNRVEDASSIHIKEVEPRGIGRVRELTLIVEEQEVDRIRSLRG